MGFPPPHEENPNAGRHGRGREIHSRREAASSSTGTRPVTPQMTKEEPYAHPGWQWCTSEGAELHTMLLGLLTTFREKVEWLEAAEEVSLRFFERSDKGHGRIERRSVYCLRDVAWVWKSETWANLKTVVLVEAETSRLGKHSLERRVYISSIDATAERFCHLIREHWHVENKLHWTLDVTFHEDHARTAKARGTHAMAILRRVALGMIRAVPSEHPMSIAMKKRITNWRFDYMLQALSSGFVAN